MRKKLKPWQKTLIAYLSFVLILAIAAVSFLLLAISPLEQYGIKNGIIEHSNAGTNITESVINATDDTLVAENSDLKLFVTPDGNISVKNKKTEKVWSSRVDDSLVSLFNKGQAETQSLCTVTYVNDKNAQAEWTSFEQSVKKKQMHIYKVSENTVRFDFIFGESSTDQLIPAGITKERFEEDILAKLDEEDAAFLKRQYLLYEADKLTAADNPDELYKKFPKLKETPIYIAGNIEAKITKQKLTKVFEKLGYTADDYDKDNELTGFGASSVTFTYKFCVDYTLSDNELTVNIPKDQIVFYTKHPMLKISLMKFFVSETDNSSVLIPSESGAIAEFIKGGNAATFKGKVYGEDLTVNQKTLPTVMDSDSSLTLPMFALRSGKDTVTAIIENSAANADLNYVRTSYGVNCYYDFTVLQSDLAYIDEKNKVIQCGNDVGAEDITVKYIFGSANVKESDETVFSKIACDYREYLKDNEMLPQNSKIDDNPTLLLDMLGSISIKKDLLGLFPVNDDLVLTDFSSAEEITEWFIDNTKANLSVKLSGWNKGGLYRQPLGEISFLNALGGKKGYESFKNSLDKKGIDLYYSAEHNTFLNPSLFDGFKQSNTALFVDGSIAELGVYSAVEGANFGEGNINIISPKVYKEIAEGYCSSNVNYISVGRFANTVNSDYGATYFDRTRSVVEICNALEIYKDNGKIISFEDANAYALKFCDRIENMPIQKGKSSVFTKSFPLKQIILHSIVDYTSEIDFSVVESKTEMLNAIKTGSGLKCTLSYKNSDYNFPTYYSFMYSTDYHNNRETVVDYMNQVNEALKGLGKVPIKSYESFGEVSKTVYENGTVIYVNTGDVDIDFDTQRIEAMSYLRVNK